MMPSPSFNTDSAFGDTLIYSSSNSVNPRKLKYYNRNSYTSYNTYVNSSRYSFGGASNTGLASGKTSIYDRYERYKSEKNEYRNMNLSYSQISSSTTNTTTTSSSQFTFNNQLNVFDSEDTISSISSFQSMQSTASSQRNRKVSFSDEVLYITPPSYTKKEKKDQTKTLKRLLKFFSKSKSSVKS